MKKLFLFIFFTLLVSVVSAQSKVGSYFWKNTITMEKCDLGGINTGGQVLSLVKQKFKVVKEIGTDVVIQIFDYKKPNTSSNYIIYNYIGSRSDYKALADDTERETKSYRADQQYFKVSIAILDAHATKIIKIPFALAAGVINYPFKIRPAYNKMTKMDFTGAFNFGAAVGLKLPSRQHDKVSFSVITGYSLSSIVLDSVSITQTKNASQLTNTNNFTAFSFSVGAIAEYERVQVGFFIGWDWLNRINQETFGWEYQGKTWLSIGLGFSIFSTKIEASPDQNISNVNK